MKKLLPTKSIVILLGVLLAGTNAIAAEYAVTVKNLTHKIYFTPLLITAHGGGTHLFQGGEAASDDLRAMAEGRDISGLSGVVGGVDEDTRENPAGGLLGPGEWVQGVVLNTDQTGNTHLSLVAMLLPTNDGFVGLDAILLPTQAGTYIYYLNGYDAGTEANDEIINGGGAPGVQGIPAAPGGDGGSNGTGVALVEANTKVHIHRGTLGDNDPNGGWSDLDVTIHRWLNPVAEVAIKIN